MTDTQISRNQKPSSAALSNGIVISIKVDRTSSVSLFDQIFTEIRGMILSGALHPGLKLPSSRMLSDELGVSRNTILQTYEQLRAEGYIRSVTGSGSYVNEDLPDNLIESNREGGTQNDVAPAKISRRVRSLSDQVYARAFNFPAFSPGVPAVREFPFQAWAKLLSEEWSNPGLGGMPADPGGYWPLRESIAQYVRASRGVECDSDQVIIVSGNREATSLAAQVLLDHGEKAIVEDPGYPGVKSSLASAGIDPVPLQMDNDGIDLSLLSKEHEYARAICVAPSHHYPLGSTMSLPRRLSLLDWAKKKQVWIIEDDYDSEFRYRSSPLPSLQSLSPSSNIIYIGSFSKVLFPSLRLGYVIVPKSVIKPFIDMKMACSGPTTLISQKVTHRLFESQLFYRHLRMMRKLYHARRKKLVHTLRDVIPEAYILPQDAGLFITLLFTEQMISKNDVAIADDAFSNGIHVEPLSSHYMLNPKKSGLILGFGALDEGKILAPVKKLAQIIARH